MGREHDTTATMNGKRSKGRALLETEEVIFRGESFRLRVPFKAIKQLDVKGDDLHLAYGDDKVSFALGAAEAEKWANAIKNPKTRADKLGVRKGQTVALVGVDDDALAGELESKGAAISKLKKGVDAIFFGANKTRDLERLASLREKIASNGAIWVVRPKGVATISEKDVMSAAKEAGLVDVKVVKLSDTHTAEKLVIPLASRQR
jgi:hypothetical protein